MPVGPNLPSPPSQAIAAYCPMWAPLHYSRVARLNGKWSLISDTVDKQGFGSGSVLIWAVGSGSGSAYKLLIRIRIQEGKNGPKKERKKDRILIFWNAGCSLLRAEGFSCSLGVFLILDHQTLDPDPDPESGSGIRIRN